MTPARIVGPVGLGIARLVGAAQLARSRIVGATGASASAPAPANTVLPVASGTVRLSQILSSTSGTWTNALTFAYQWRRDGVPITGATATTYTVVSADVAALLSCAVVATGPGGVSAPVASNALASALRPIFLMSPDFIWSHSDQPAQSAGSPVAALINPFGTTLTTAQVTGRQATWQANHLAFDGLDDEYRLNATVLAAINTGAVARIGSVVLAASAPYGTTGDRLWYGYAGPNNAARFTTPYDRFAPDAQTIYSTTFITYAALKTPDNTPSLTIDTYDRTQPGGVYSARYRATGGVLTSLTNTTTPIGTFAGALLFAVVGAGPSSGNSSFHRDGQLRFIAQFSRVLTPAEAATINTTLTALGYC